jgi:lipopolysaccharide biosynthesis glycosyltransferase
MSNDTVMSYDFADQSLLGDLFFGRWVALPYVYNALKTLRWQDVHSEIWRDNSVKNVHYILSPKPWDENEEVRAEAGGKEVVNKAGDGKRDGTHAWWWKINGERKEAELAKESSDGF